MLINCFLDGGKVLFSLGGYTGSVYFSTSLATEESRNKFKNQVLEFNTLYGFDGVDLDWEYPGREGQGSNCFLRNSLEIY